MADWEIWVVILVLGVATACTRSAFWLIGHKVTIPPRVQEMLRYAPACALAAIVFPDMVLGPQGELQLALANPETAGRPGRPRFLPVAPGDAADHRVRHAGADTVACVSCFRQHRLR
jgi:branched-subunit amino acid transport protein